MSYDEISKLVITLSIVNIVLCSIPVITATIRRYHDVGKSCFWLFLPWLLLFVINAILFSSINFNVNIVTIVEYIFDCFKLIYCIFVYPLGTKVMLAILVVLASRVWVVYLAFKSSIYSEAPVAEIELEKKFEKQE